MTHDQAKTLNLAESIKEFLANGGKIFMEENGRVALNRLSKNRFPVRDVQVTSDKTLTLLMETDQ